MPIKERSQSAQRYKKDEKTIAEALEWIDGQSERNVSEAARKFKVPYKRLLRRYQGRLSRSTRKPAGPASPNTDSIWRGDRTSEGSTPTVDNMHFANLHERESQASAGESSPVPAAGLVLSPKRTSTIPSKQAQWGEIAPSNGVQLAPRQEISDSYTLQIALDCSNWKPTAVSSGAATFASNRTDVHGLFSDRSRVSHSPTPPQALLVSENLFHNVKVYFEYTCQKMIFDDDGILLTPNRDKFHNGLCNDFDSYCFTATMLKGKGLYVEFRRALSKACALVQQILEAEHPQTLACFLEVFIHLIQSGLLEVAVMLCRFVQTMSAKVTKEGDPWGRICWLLGKLDPECLGQAMAQIWKCTTNVFDSKLGKFSRLAVAVRLDYIKRVIDDDLEEARLLRELLQELNNQPGDSPRLSIPRAMLNLAHNLNKQGHHIDAEKTALEVVSLLEEHEIYANRTVERIECLKIASRSQLNQGRILEAEQNMREAIRVISKEWGVEHPWCPEFMSVLEGWLRSWGREEGAEALRREIEKLMGKDEINE